MKEVKFTQMKDGDKDDYNFLTKHEVEHTKGTADRLLKALVDLDQSLSGYKVTRLTKSVDFFAPMVSKVFARKPYDPIFIRRNEREPLQIV